MHLQSDHSHISIGIQVFSVFKSSFRATNAADAKLTHIIRPRPVGPGGGLEQHLYAILHVFFLPAPAATSRCLYEKLVAFDSGDGRGNCCRCFRIHLLLLLLERCWHVVWVVVEMVEASASAHYLLGQLLQLSAAHQHQFLHENSEEVQMTVCCTMQVQDSIIIKVVVVVVRVVVVVVR